MINNKVIIAIVGATRGIKEHPNGDEITNISRQVGQEITHRQHILLSGGEPKDKFPAPVHTASMYGARQAGVIGKPARLISVLREKNEFKLHLETGDPKCKQLIIDTTFGDERNFINGYIPDVMIAIHGGAGTLSEIAFANYNHIPVIFTQIGNIDTIKELQAHFPQPGKPGDKLLNMLKAAQKEFQFEMEQLLEKTFALINNQAGLNTAVNIKSLIDKAIELSAPKENKLPDHNKLSSFNKKFKLKLEELS